MRSPSSFVLIGTESAIAGNERLLAAFASGDDLLVPIEVDRRSNADLLIAEHVYVRDGERCERRTVIGITELDGHDRRYLQHSLSASLGEHLAVLHLGPAHETATRSQP